MDVLPLIQQLLNEPATAEQEQLRKQLSLYLNDLLLHDFPSLVQLLYMVDVPEQKLKAVLKEKPETDAGSLIADLLIERLRQKRLTKQQYRFPADGSEEERW